MQNFGIWATFRNKITILFNSPSITHKDEHFKKTKKKDENFNKCKFFNPLFGFIMSKTVIVP